MKIRFLLLFLCLPLGTAYAEGVHHDMGKSNMKITFKKEVDIHSDDVVQFVVMNLGKMKHEFAIGSPAEQKERRNRMKSMTGYHHDSDNAMAVEPGKAKQMMWHFHGDPTVELSCNLPGHYEAGMTKRLEL